MKKAVIYLRVSTEEQAEKGFSIDAQRDECIQKAQELGCEGIIEYIDEGVSGSILERPMLINAMEEMKNRIIDFFICFDSSRLSRNVSHQLILIDTIKKYGTKLVFVRNNYEDTAEGRFQITIMAAVDEYERAPT
jgi:site-specific DNA recombinase